jgi:branched-subunit amino acid transport protein
MELDPGQLALIGIAASVITAVLKFLAGRLGFEVPSNYAKILVFVVAVVMAGIWMKPDIGFSEDPLEFATNLLAAAVAVMGSARAVYEILLGRLGLNKLK